MQSVNFDFNNPDFKIFCAGFLGAFARLLGRVYELVKTRNPIFTKANFIGFIANFIITMGGILVAIMAIKWLKLNFEQSIVAAYLAGYMSHSFFKYIDKKESVFFESLYKKIKP